MGRLPFGRVAGGPALFAIGVLVAAGTGAGAASNPFVRVDQDGNVYYGHVLGSAAGSRFVATCANETIRIEPDAVVQDSSRQCLDLADFTGAKPGPPPPEAGPLDPARSSALLVADPVTVLHYDAGGKPLTPLAGVVSGIGDARDDAFGNIASELSLRLGVTVVWTPSSRTQPADLAELCRARRAVGILVLSSPRLELFEPKDGVRIANLYAHLDGYRCNDQSSADIGPLAEGSKDTNGSAWTDDDGIAAFGSLVTSIRRQLLALVN